MQWAWRRPAVARQGFHLVSGPEAGPLLPHVSEGGVVESFRNEGLVLRVATVGYRGEDQSMGKGSRR